VAEMSASGVFQRSYIYLGGQLLALKLASGYSYWVHEDPVTKSKRVTDMFGAVTSTIELDPQGDTDWSTLCWYHRHSRNLSRGCKSRYVQSIRRRRRSLFSRSADGPNTRFGRARARRDVKGRGRVQFATAN